MEIYELSVHGRLPPGLREHVPLSTLTTLGVGGPAHYLARCRSVGELAEVLAWGRARELEVFLLGAGSNLLVADRGFPGLVIQLRDDSIELAERGAGEVLVRAAAGADWDVLVARTVAEGLAGLECLSGIPGRVGAAPIQNVGAYGQEVAETVRSVEVVELKTGERRELPAESCGFAYRRSRFKGRWRGRYAVTRVDFLLPQRRSGTVRYADLSRRFAGGRPSLAEVRRAVLEIRRSKSMVLDPGDPNRRSAGSFFLNPVVTAEQAAEIRERFRGAAGRPMPEFPAAGGGVKLSAARLIEEAGFRRGDRHGGAGISTRHSLALVNRGGATAVEIVALAAKIRRRVRDLCGVTLEPEPVFLGFEKSVDEMLR